MPSLNITAAQFGVAVSAYAFRAGLSGNLSAGFADRFDRKRLLLFFYAGFALGTLVCTIALNYHLLLSGLQGFRASSPSDGSRPWRLMR